MNMAMSTPIINNGISRSRIGAKNKVAGTVTVAKPPTSIYGHVAVGEESEDSENSSVYHEPFKLLPSSAKQEYGCLLKKDALSSSKSGEYTGESSKLSISI